MFLKLLNIFSVNFKRLEVNLKKNVLLISTTKEILNLFLKTNKQMHVFIFYFKNRNLAKIMQI